MSASQPYPWNEIAEHGIDRNAILIARSAKDVHEEEKKINTRSLVYSFKIEMSYLQKQMSHPPLISRFANDAIVSRCNGLIVRYTDERHH